MNKCLHRTVFSPARGALVVVPETAGSAGKATGASSAIVAAALASLFAAPASAQIRSDPAAPGIYRPQALAAPNGTPLVNITAPSAAGVSYGVQSARISPGATGSMGRSGTNGRSRTGETNGLEQTTLVPATLTGNQINVTATGGDVTLAGARIDADRVNLNAAQGAVNLGVVVTGTEVSQQRGGKDLMYQRASDAGVRTESANYTRIDSPNVAVNAPRVNVQIGQNVQQSASAGPGVTSQTLSQAIASQAGQPGLQWLSQVQNDAQLNNLQVNWQGVPLAQRQWAERQSGLTQTGAAVVTIVATVLTWGTAGGAGLAVEGAAGSGAWGAAAGAAVQAGIANIAGQASVSLINHSGDIGAVLDDLSSRQGVHSLLTSMATAGAVQWLNTSLGIEGWTTANGASPLQVLGRNVLDGAAAAVVGTAINGGSLEDNLAAGLANGLLNTAASESASWIGGNTTGVANAVSHAVVGCLVGAGRASAGSYGASGCSAGAVGAVVGELAAGYYNPTQDRAFAGETIQFGQLMAGIAGALVGGNQASADIAAAAGANAVENNWLSGRQRVAANAARTPQAIERWAATDASQQAVLDELNAARDEAARAGTAQERQAAYEHLQSATAAASNLAEGFRSTGDQGGAGTVGRALLGATTEMQRLAGDLGVTPQLSDAQRQGLAQSYAEMGMAFAATEGSVASNGLGARAANAVSRWANEPGTVTSGSANAAARIENNFYRDGAIADPTAPMSASGPWRPAAAMTGAEADAMVSASLPPGARQTGARSADALNREAMIDGQAPPYVPGSQVLEVTTTQPTAGLVRVYTEVQGQSMQAGSWLMRAEDIAGLSREQIASRFGLPQVPTMVTDANIPAGININVSVANGISPHAARGNYTGGNGGGGGMQFQITTRVSRTEFETWFTNPRPLR